MKINNFIAITLVAAGTFATSGAWAANFKVAVGDAQGGTQWELATKFKEAFEQKTGVKHTVSLFPNGQLGSEESTSATPRWGRWTFPFWR